MIRLTTMIRKKKQTLKKGVGEGGYMDPVVNRVINNPMKK